MYRRLLLVGVMAFALTGRCDAVCVGDCGTDGEVTVDELILGVNIALGSVSLSECVSIDSSVDGEVTVDELISAVNNALTGCPAGNYAGNYSATVSFDATHSGSISLSADASGQITGSLMVTSPRRFSRFSPDLSFTFPVGGVSVAVSGSYAADTGGFEVEGSFVDANGQTVSVVISGDLPGPTGSAPINVYVGSDPPFATTLSAGMLATPTPTPGPTPPPGNGPRIVYAAPLPDPHVYVINVDGSGKLQVSHSVGVDSDPAWSPDGTQIAFATPDSQNHVIGIAVVNADGSNQHMLFSDSTFLDGNPAWSPDGNKIVFTAGGGDAIDIMNADGSGRHRLVTKSGGESYGHMSWSPDGGRIAVESTRPRDSGNQRLEIWVMNADGTGFVRLTNNEVFDEHPAWSPDGTTILFGTNRGFAGAGVFRISPNGTGEAQLTHNPFGGDYPAWSRDGHQIAYTAFLGITVANADDSNRTMVPGTVGVSDFDFR